METLLVDTRYLSPEMCCTGGNSPWIQFCKVLFSHYHFADGCACTHTHIGKCTDTHLDLYTWQTYAFCAPALSYASVWALLDSLHIHDKCNFRYVLFHFRNVAVSCDGLLNARYRHRIRCTRVVRNAAKTYYSFYYMVTWMIMHIVFVWNISISPSFAFIRV